MFTEQKLFIFPYVLHTLLDLVGCQWWARREFEVINKIKIIETLHSDLLPATNWRSRMFFFLLFLFLFWVQCSPGSDHVMGPYKWVEVVSFLVIALR